MSLLDLESAAAMSVGCAIALATWVLTARRPQRRTEGRRPLDLHVKHDPRNGQLDVRLSRRGD
jgi:hypothetical protein